LGGFDAVFDQWLKKQIEEEINPRRRELLQKGLGHATVELLRTIWYPVIGNLDHLYPEWEIRDFSNRYRYLDLAYLPGGAKGCIEIHGYRSHARDIETWRFKDLCMKQALLTLDDWYFLPIAYLSITEDPEVCKQLVLSFVGKFLSMPAANAELDWAEEETLRFARRLLRPFTSEELAAHLKRSDRQAKRILDKLVSRNKMFVLDGKRRYRYYQLTELSNQFQRWTTDRLRRA
jgi:hypothetical protein